MITRKSRPVGGRIVPSPRLTLYGAWMIALYAGTPILALGVLLDLIRALLD
jgi:hypothetical protein